MSDVIIVASFVARKVFLLRLARLIVLLIPLPNTNMSTTLANSWSAHYAKLAATSTDDDKLPEKYSLVLPPSTAAGTCRDNLISVPDCVALLISPSGRVHLLHHAHWDKPTPVYTEGTNKIWTLLGVGDSPPVATFDHLALAKSVSEAAPSWEAMRDAPDAAAFKALTPDTDAAALGLTCNAVVALSPSLAYHLFSENSDDPAVLGATLARAMNTADRYLAQLGQAPGAVATGPPTVTPVSTPFYEACALLWLASQPNFAATVPIEILHVGAPAAWAKRVSAATILSATPGSGPNLTAASQATENLTEVCGLLRDSIVASTTQRATSKDSKGFKKLPTHTQLMILRASEPTAAGYADAQGLLLRTEPVTEYGEVLAATSSSHALSVTVHYIRDVFKCSVLIPASLATAIYHGQFRWPSMFSRGAFSIFSLPPASATGQLAARTEEERVQLELEATEGKGISAAQAIATAKIHHSPIKNPPALQDFLSNKLHINVLVFGRDSPLTKFLHTWSRHTVAHRESYELLTDADASFCSRVGHIIDMAEQAFLSSCITAEKTSDIDVGVLDHSFLRTGISMGMMPAIAIPATLSSMIVTPQGTARPRPPAPLADEPAAKRLRAPREREREREKPPRDREPAVKRAVVVTRTVPSSWKAIVDNGNHFFSLSSHLSPLDTLMKCPSPGLCGKLLLRGRCIQSGCPRGDSHATILAFDAAQNTAVDKWFTSTCHDLKVT
jgi:hypothetical protein